MTGNRFVIGSGSGFSDDLLDGAQRLADSGVVDCIAFDRLAERTLALAQLRHLEGGDGFDLHIDEIVERFGAFVAQGGKLVGNFGAANPEGAAERFAARLRAGGLTGKVIGVVTGDDVHAQAKDLDLALPEMGTTISELGDKFVSAHAYIGADSLMDCLVAGADVIVGGRVADPSLWVAPLCHARGWSLDDWDQLANATLVAHILECGSHLNGGGFSDPPLREVPGAAHLGAPYGEVSEDGSLFISQLATDAGIVNRDTIRGQLGYEIFDPSSYITPDVVADLSDISLEEVGPNRVRVGGARGRKRPDELKVLVGVDLGWKTVGGASWGGPNCVSRAELAAASFGERLAGLGDEVVEYRHDLVGINSLFGQCLETRQYEPNEVRLRVATVTRSRAGAEAIGDEIWALWRYAAGAGGMEKVLTRHIGVTPAMIPRSAVTVSSRTLTV